MTTEQTAADSSDLALAAELQAALLPKACPQDCQHQRLAARNRMCGHVGGDFYDFLRINDEQIAFLIGDVVGHGIRGALLMAKIMGFLRSEAQNLAQPTKVMSALNDMLVDVGDRTESVLVCSMFYVVVDLPSGVAIYVNAGHPQPFLCSRTTCQTLHLGPRNLLLGIEEFDPKEGCYTFTSGQRLVLYTDGITEAHNVDRQMFGDDRLHKLVTDHADADAEQLAQIVFDAVDEFRRGAERTDDESIVVVDRL